MQKIWFYSIISVVIVSLVSLIGIFGLFIKTDKLKNIIIDLVGFSAGALLGDVFIHILPEFIKDNGFSINFSLTILLGIIFSFILEKIIQWHHCHMPITKRHIHSFAYMNLAGDLIHNFIDGLIISASYLTSLPIGIATTVAVVLHEIPQEMGDFGVLIHGGFTKRKALFYNYLTATSAILGAILTLIFQSKLSQITIYLLPFAAGNFLYIANSDLIPELHKETEIKKSLRQVFILLCGVGVMSLLLFLK